MNPTAPGGLDEALFAPPTPPSPEADLEAETGETLFASTDEWMTGWLQRFATQPAVWCDNWAAHPDAASRLHDLWQAWEVAVAEGGAAMSSWWLLHFDGHTAALGAARGPFARCQTGHTTRRTVENPMTDRSDANTLAAARQILANRTPPGVAVDGPIYPDILLPAPHTTSPNPRRGTPWWVWLILTTTVAVVAATGVYITQQLTAPAETTPTTTPSPRRWSWPGSS